MELQIALRRTVPVITDLDSDPYFRSALPYQPSLLETNVIMFKKPSPQTSLHHRHHSIHPSATSSYLFFP